jgi:hypothetical protein
MIETRLTRGQPTAPFLAGTPAGIRSLHEITIPHTG